jgi:2-polyprenyl-6-methoxyphenol hydroxylase-like FAD-dependent oxidoreductase
MRIAICGGGIAGLALYLWLDKLGLDENEICIYERRESALDHSMEDESSYSNAIVGGSLGIAPNGLRSLRRIDSELHDDIARTGCLNTRWRISNSRGWTLMEIKTGFSNVFIGRDDLWQCLRKRVPDGVVSKKKLVDVHTSAGGWPATLSFADGSEAIADLVVGADGIRSIVRRCMFGDEINGPKSPYSYEPRYEGLVGVCSFVPARLLDSVPESQTK